MASSANWLRLVLMVTVFWYGHSFLDPLSDGVPLQESMLAVQQRVFKRLQSIGADGSLLTFPWCYHDPDERDLHERLNLASLPGHLSSLAAEKNFTDMEYFELLKARNKSALNVYVDIGIYQIVEVNEKQRFLTLKLQTAMCWEDCRIAWQYSQFPLSQLILSPRLFSELKLFVPYVTMLEELNPIVSSQADYDAVVISGFICIRKTYPTTISCNLDVKMYPLDTQRCHVTFEAMQDKTAVSLHPYEDLLNDSSLTVVASSIHTMAGRYTPSDTWELIILNGERKTRNTCTEHDSQDCQFFDSISHSLILRRHPTYQLINLMLPAFVIVIISSCVFILPPGSEDKMGLSITVLLSMFIFMQIMYNKMPETGETLPLLSQYYLVCVGMVALSCIVSSISVVFESSNVLAPTWLRLVVRRCSAVSLRTGDITTDTRASLSLAERALHESIKDNKVKDQRSARDSVPLRQLAIVFDRVFFFIHVFASVLVFIIYFVYGFIPWKNYNYQFSDSEWSYVEAQLSLAEDNH